MGLRVIGAGFGRTGTMSLKAALEELGFDPCYHMIEVYENPKHVGLWEGAIQGEPVDWQEIFHGYKATVDWPGAAFYERLMAEHPEAKVILTVRDPERWYESTLNTIYGMRKLTYSPLLSLGASLVPRLKHLRRTALMAGDLIWERVFDDRFEDRRYAIEVFERHNESVKRRVPADRLLVYEVREGWEPLCAFLEVSVPDRPFPHLNDTESFRRMFWRRYAVASTVGVAALAPLATLMIWRLRRPAGG
ncbi:MAG: sulfotransferase family protein [Actinomycetota bacterium]|nr:sulfotransferase family protein [Actinomycetota bacterium]